MTAPKFCGACGKSITLNLASAPAPKYKKRIEAEFKDDEEMEEDGVIRDYKASISFDVTPIAPAQSVDSVLKQKPTNLGSRDPDPTCGNKTGDELLQIISKQGSNKTNISIE